MSTLPLTDVHVHHIPRPILDWLLSDPARHHTRFGSIPGRPGNWWLTIGDRWAFPLDSDRVHDSTTLVAELDTGGVGRAALSPVPQLFCYWLDPDFSVALSRRVNDELLALARAHPGRFWVLGQVPLNVPEAAAAELERAMALGAAGAMIGTDVEGTSLDDPALSPFWDAADRLGAVVSLHPQLGRGPGLDRFFLANLLGNPNETALAATGLMLSGHFDRYRRVRVVLPHGGGNLLFQLSRLDIGYRMRHETRSGGAAYPPSHYLRRFWFDTVLWDPRALRFLVEVAGADRVALGSDIPFWLAAWPHTATLEALAPLGKEVLAQVAHRTAFDLMGAPIS